MKGREGKGRERHNGIQNILVVLLIVFAFSFPFLLLQLVHLVWTWWSGTSNGCEMERL